MKVSERWLREWVNPNVDTAGLVEQLTHAGLEVGGVEVAGGELTDVVVAQIVAVEPHPGADKLCICQVDAGGEHVQVVCGAANAYSGMKAPLAQVGAKLPDGATISTTVLRGVASAGMLCSEKELGMADTAEGLMELPADAPTGQRLRDYLQLDDHIIDIELTPNRGDCLSVMGVAREVAASNAMQHEAMCVTPVAATIEDELPITLENPIDCPAYTGRVIRGINPNAHTPLWMREKLRRGGLRSLSPVVDITNFILLELGQPMHAFDLEKLNGGIHVRKAASGEQLTLLDGKVVKLQDDILVIADDSTTLAMAGVMGGQASAVSGATTDIFLESAFFQPVAIAGRARRYGLYTESAHRFERGVGPELQLPAMQRATQLLLEICGGSAGPVAQAVERQALPGKDAISLRAQQVQRVLGVDLADAKIEECLTRLQLEYTGGNGKWRVKPPSYRFDLNIEADLVEEIARLYGYNNILEAVPVVRQSAAPKATTSRQLEFYKDVLSQRGWQEAVTYSFVDPELQRQLQAAREPVSLSNPLSGEMSVMRTSHWPGLIGALQYNQRRQQKQLRLFEVGLNFVKKTSAIEQSLWISGIAAGDYCPEQWGQRQRHIDFYDVKGDVETLLAYPHGRMPFVFKPEPHPALHPGQSARILQAGQAVGWLGVVHPELQQKLSLEGPVVLFEISEQALIGAKSGRFQPISKFPSIRRDVSVIVDQSVTAGEVLAVIDGLSVNTVVKRWIFDVYQGKNIELGRKSMSLGLILLDSSRTLTDNEADEVVRWIVAGLAEQLNANLRE